MGKKATTKDQLKTALIRVAGLLAQFVQAAAEDVRTVESALSSHIANKNNPHGVTTITGNAGTATKLATTRAVDGVNFNGSAAITHYGACSTAAATAAKIVTLTGFALVSGARVAVKFTYANTAANPTLNVNGTGAKSIKAYGTSVVTNLWNAGEIAEFVYDGTNFVMVNGYTAYYARNHSHSYVPTSRTINGKALSSNVTLTASDVGAAEKPLSGTCTIPASGWSTDSTVGYPKYCDITISGVTAKDRADIIIAPGSVQTAADCGLCPVSDTMAGKVRIRAAKVPAAAINAEYWIERG